MNNTNSNIDSCTSTAITVSITVPINIPITVPININNTIQYNTIQYNTINNAIHLDSQEPEHYEYDVTPCKDDDIDETESDYEENHNDEPGRSPRRRRCNSRMLQGVGGGK
jgi:hypothetical protein